MADVGSPDQLVRGIQCLGLAISFEEDRARFGLPEAIDRLRSALISNGLWLADDDQLMADVLQGRVSSERFAEALCSMKRMRLPGGTGH